MGGTFLEFIKSVGIFILCAQSFMHFAAGKAYEKYIKLLIGVMILAQFIVPVRALFLGDEHAQIWGEVERFQKELETVIQEVNSDVAASMEMEEAGAGEKEALEAEIKERLTDIAGSYKRAIEKVELKEEPPKLIVTVYRVTKEEGRGEKIKVEKITIGTDEGQDIENMPEEKKRIAEELAAAFSKALGTDADYVEVIMK